MSCDADGGIGNDDDDETAADEVVVGLCEESFPALKNGGAYGGGIDKVVAGHEDPSADFGSATGDWMKKRVLSYSGFPARIFVDCLHLRRILFD